MPQLSIQQAMAQALQSCQAGRLREAEAIYRQILQAQPSHMEALNNLGVVLQNLGRLTDAQHCFRAVAAAHPQQADAHLNLAMTLQQMRQLDQAEQSYRQALAINPDLAQAWTNLGLLLQARMQLAEAEECHQKALALEPRNADAHSNLGSLRIQQKRTDAAIESFRAALALRPDHATARHNLAGALADCGRVDQAIESYGHALAARPDFPAAHQSLGSLLTRQGRVEEGLAHLRQAVSLDPRSREAHSNLLYAMYCHPTITTAEIQREHQLWTQLHARPLMVRIRPHANDRSPGRPLKIGYVSPDFNSHVVGRLIEALLAHHDHQQFHITCYSDTTHSDSTTQRLRAQADVWQPTDALDNAALADRVRQDQIDILIDLAGHLDHNRLLLFARKPAPVQATYLGFLAPTGLETMDYRMTDRYLEADSGIGFRVSGFGEIPKPDTRYPIPEQPFCLPTPYWCYTPPANAPPVAGLPALAAGSVTFASFNNLAKVNADVLALWAKVLQAVPGSRLLLVAFGGQHNRHVWETLEHHGVDRFRATLLDRQPIESYWPLYNHADIALDPFPYNGGVTSLDSLYMGVPIITLAGHRPMARAGVTILSHLALPELIAQTPDQYIQIAAALANDLPRLANLRRTLRQRLLASPLMDAPRFARGVESAYRQMWRTWCES